MKKIYTLPVLFSLPLFAHSHAVAVPHPKTYHGIQILTLTHAQAFIPTLPARRQDTAAVEAVFSAPADGSRNENAGLFPLPSLKATFNTSSALKIWRQSQESRARFKAPAAATAWGESGPAPVAAALPQGLPAPSGEGSVRMKSDPASDSLVSREKSRKGEPAADLLKKRAAGYATIRNHFGFLCLLYLTGAALIGIMRRSKRSRRLNNRRNLQMLHIMTERRTEKGTASTAPKNCRVPDSLASAVLLKLETLEKNFFFLETGMTLHKLASRLNTNTTYLSAIIREHKGCKFNAYLKQLRISYVTRMLCENRHWRLYTVETLAAECGFKDRTHFARSFADYHGMTLAEFQLANPN